VFKVIQTFLSVVSSLEIESDGREVAVRNTGSYKHRQECLYHLRTERCDRRTEAEGSVNWYPLPRYLRLRHPPSLRFGETGAYGGQVGSYDVASISTAWIR
jgi:hypothetical protein